MQSFVAWFKQLPPSSLMVGMTTSILLGIGTAALLSGDSSQWAEWSFSALGERQTPSARIFTVAVALSAGLMWGVARALHQQFMRLEAVLASKVTLVCLRTIAFCLFAVAIFPNDTQHMLHYTFSRLLVLVFAGYILILPPAITITRQQKIALYTIGTASVLICWYGLVEENISFVFFEAIAGALGMVWIYVLCRIVQQMATATVEVDQLTAVPQKAS